MEFLFFHIICVQSQHLDVIEGSHMNNSAFPIQIGNTISEFVW